MTLISQAVLAVHTEIYAQNEKWGEQNHNPVEWMAILTEEVGEAAQQAVDYHFNPDKSPATKQLERLEEFKKELTQVAAVAVQAMMSINRLLGETD
jgi:NTP pyrophosphatase (non-canonical NTP hydrolase)